MLLFKERRSSSISRRAAALEFVARRCSLPSQKNLEIPAPIYQMEAIN